MSGAKLKSCPYCGDEEISILTSSFQSGATADKYVECHKCEAMGPHSSCEKYGDKKAEQQAIAAWNRRVKQ